MNSPSFFTDDQDEAPFLTKTLGEVVQEKNPQLTSQEAESIVSFYCKHNRMDQPLDLQELAKVIALIKEGPSNDLIDNFFPLDGQQISTILSILIRQKFFACLKVH